MVEGAIYYEGNFKKYRRTKKEIEFIKRAMYEVVDEYRPMTVRQIFYQMVSRGVVDKTENEYKNTVGRLLVNMRRGGELPFGWIADNTRWMRKPVTHSSWETALRRAAEAYRRSLWDNQGVYVELWLEKDALAGVLMQETTEWDVPLMVTRGFSSLSYLYEAAEEILRVGKPTHLYYFGDNDPSGVDINRAVEEGLREFAPDAEIHFERVAVTEEQIRLWDLPTRPTKKSDSRSKKFEGESVEVDAIPPEALRDLACHCITQHISEEALFATTVAEASEKKILMRIANSLTIKAIAENPAED